MSVIRVEKAYNYTVMSNVHLRDMALSLGARGLMSMMLSLPDDWGYSISGLCTLCTESETAIRARLKELEAAGYLIRHKITGEHGRIAYDYVLHESPHIGFPHTDEPHTDEPHTDEPHTEDRPLLNTDIQNTDIQSTDIQSTERVLPDSANAPSKPTRHKYGQYENVLLSDTDLEKLKTEYPTDWEQRIERLSEYIASKGAKYKNHLATIRAWARKEVQQNAKPIGSRAEDGSRYEKGVGWNKLL